MSAEEKTPESLLTFSGRRHLVAEIHETPSRFGPYRYAVARCNGSITMNPDRYQEADREVGLCKRCFKGDKS